MNPTSIPVKDMCSKYILVDKIAVKEPNLLKWAEFYEDIKNRRVEETFVGKVRVSTVFLGLDHGWGKKVLLFETMIFGGKHDQFQDRYSTWEEAEKGHQKAVKRCKGKNGKS